MESHTPAAGKHVKKDTHSYKGWLNSDHFWKRALAVYGYSFVAAFMIMVVCFVAILFWGLVAAVIS